MFQPTSENKRGNGVIIRSYRHEDEVQWVRCRALSFLDTAYFDHVLREKEKYDHDAIELVATLDEEIIGLIDIEIERESGSICSNHETTSGMIWHLAVHPDFRRKGIAKKLLYRAIEIAQEKGIRRLEAWTRDDEWVMKWYERMGFIKKSSYLQVFVEGREELKEALKSNISGLHLVTAFAHYVGTANDEIKSKFKRVHETSQYELWINQTTPSGETITT